MATSAGVVIVPARAAALIAVVIAEINNVEAGFAPAIAVEKARLEVELQRMIEVVAATLGITNGAQLQLDSSGRMVFIPAKELEKHEHK